MAGVRNLTQVEAAERARLLDVTAYDISLDLTDGAGWPADGRTFRSTTEVRFTCTEPGATHVHRGGRRVGALRDAQRHARRHSPAGRAEKGLTLPGWPPRTCWWSTADFRYSNSGQGLHRTVDPVDKEVYLYSQFETADAQRVYACFDQPDLKSVYTWHVTVPAHWQVVSNMPVAARGAGGSRRSRRCTSPSRRG